MSKELAETLGELARQKQFVLIGDMSHRELPVISAAAQADNMQALKKAGVKHLFLEVPQDMQPSLDRYLAGKIQAEDFYKTLEKKHPRALETEMGDRPFNVQLLKMAELAHENGMKVYCADHRSAKLKSLQRPYEDYAQQGGMVSFEEYLEKKHTSKMPDGSKVSIFTDDRPLAEFIAKRAGNDKAAIFYGAGHGQTSYGLDEILGEDRTARVEISSEKPGKLSRFFTRIAASMEGMALDKDPPAAAYYANSNEVERFAPKAAADLVRGNIELRGLEQSKSGLDGEQASPATRHEKAPTRRSSAQPH